MSESHSPTASPKQLILMCVSTLLGTLLRGELASQGDLEIVRALTPEMHQGKRPDLVLMEVTEANEAAAQALFDTSPVPILVFIGPLRNRAPSNDPGRLSAQDVPKLNRPLGGIPSRREVRELSADVSVAEIARVCVECLKGPPRQAAVAPPPSLGSSPFQMFLGTIDGGASLPSLPAPLFPTSAPPSSHPSQRPSSGAPPPGPNSDDAEHESLFQLDPSLRSLLDEAERRVVASFSPRFTSPPDPAHTAQEAGFILSAEVKAALEERLGAYEPARRQGRTSVTPNSSWVTRTGHGPGRRGTGSDVSDATSSGETSIPTSAGESLPTPIASGSADITLQRETIQPFSADPSGQGPPEDPARPAPVKHGFKAPTSPVLGKNPPRNQQSPPPWTEAREKTPVSHGSPALSASATGLGTDSQNQPPDSDAKDRSIADTTPPRRPTARDAVRPPRLSEEASEGNTGHHTTAEVPSEPRPSAKRDFDRVTGEHERSSTPQQPSASSHDQLGQDKRPTRPPGIRTLPSGRSLDAPTLQPSVPPLAAPEPSAGETMSPLSPGGRRLSDVPPLREGDAIQVVARAIRTRYTGAIAVEAEGSVRRIVMRDGDFVTAASGIARESLLGFLVSQGTLAADVATKLSHRLPNFGRHAGAALIAAGHLTQEQMWPSLRAHAEHIISLVLQVREGLAGFEEQVPERLAAEPAVFGGATGAEILIELVRRTVPPQLALVRLGGTNSTLSAGIAHGLLEECALSQLEHEALERLYHAPLSTNVKALPYPEFASVLYALVELRVLKRETPTHETREAREAPVRRPLDEQAIRQLIANRKALVEEADYFQLLGLSPSATGYQVNRAYESLKQTFDPSAILTAGTADLSADVDLIHSVLDEAFDILRDEVRRERYRTAILSTPAR